MDEIDEYSDDDAASFEEEALKSLRDGELVVKNADGTLRCPFSPSRKKQAYPYRDLLQHAEGVAKGKRGPEAGGKHSALAKFLKTDLESLATPPAERIHKLEMSAPQRNGKEDFLVCPWAGLIYNVDNSKRGDDGRRVGPGQAEIKKHFHVFNPESAKVFWSPMGHTGLAVITFGRTLEALNDAQAFEKWFVERGHGRRDWERRRSNPGSELYGWLARREDREGRREIKDDFYVSKYLTDLGDLKHVGMIGDEIKKMQDQRLNNLAETVSRKTDEFQNLLLEVEIERRKSDEYKRQLEEKHRKELEDVRLKAQKFAEDHKKSMEANNERLQATMDSLQRRCKELETREKLMQSEVDRTRLEQEKMTNRLQLDIVQQQSDLQKRHHATQMKLRKKHQEESEKLANYIQTLNLRLALKQESELQDQRLGERKDAEKFTQLTETFTIEEMWNQAKEMEGKMESVKKENEEYKEELENVKETQEFFEKQLNVLTTIQRTSVDEIENAKKVAVKALVKHGAKDSISVKKMGEIDQAPWANACKRVYEQHTDGWEVIFKTKLSFWEGKLMDPNFSPFKTVPVGRIEDDKWERKVDENDEDLFQLKVELGPEVLQTVVTALQEIESHNASGRYIVHLPWNFQTNKEASLAEVIQHFVSLVEKYKKPVKKRRIAGPS